MTDKTRADAQAPAPMVDSYENWNYLIISQFSSKEDSHENKITLKMGYTMCIFSTPFPDSPS